MSEQYTPNLGQTPSRDARRDAVHIAVIPVVATHTLYPGHHVGINESGCAYAPNYDYRSDKTIGIVDPFLGGGVNKGEQFWLFLYPGTITSLRHVWTHPAFTAKVPVKLDGE